MVEGQTAVSKMRVSKTCCLANRIYTYVPHGVFVWSVEMLRNPSMEVIHGRPTYPTTKDISLCCYHQQHSGIVVVPERVQTEAGAAGHHACAARGALRVHGRRPCHDGHACMEAEQENVQAGTGDHGVDSAHFVIVFIIASHAGHVSGTDEQIAWPQVHDLS